MKSKKTLIGLDLATKSGVSIFDIDAEKLLYSDTLFLPRNDGQLRLQQLYEELEILYARYKPVEAAIEDVFLPVKTSPRTPIALGELRGVARLWAVNHNIQVNFYPPRKVKLAITGFGNAAKSDIITWIENEFSIKVKDDNEADAISIAWTHLLERRFMSCIDGG